MIQHVGTCEGEITFSYNMLNNLNINHKIRHSFSFTVRLIFTIYDLMLRNSTFCGLVLIFTLVSQLQYGSYGALLRHPG